MKLRISVILMCALAPTIYASGQQFQTREETARIAAALKAAYSRGDLLEAKRGGPGISRNESPS